MKPGAWRLVGNEERLFLIVAVFIGIYAGLAVVCFRLAIEAVRLQLLGSELAPDWWRTLLMPAAAGGVVAIMVNRAFPTVRGSGVNQTKAALYIYDGYIAFRTVVGKFLTCALAIGGGQSLGPEDPSLQIGAGLGAMFGRRFRLSREHLRFIPPIGAAAGLAAAFNSPVTAVLFVIEEVIGRWSAGVLGAVVLGAVASVVTEQWFLGDQPLFRVPDYHLVHASEMLAYAGLGLLGGVLSLVFVKGVVTLRPRMRALPVWTWYVQPVAAGLLIGAIGLRFPQVLGDGYAAIDGAMHDQFAWPVLAALCLLKVLTTTASFVSGTPGGLFAPTLFVGAMLGGAVCGLQRLVAPEITGPIGAYALVGMGTMFAGTLRAPITSVFMIVEVSGNYSIVVPVMVSNTIAYLVSRQFQRVALFDQLARQDGVDLPSMEEEREHRALTVEGVMRAADGITLPGEETVAQAAARAAQLSTEHFLVALPHGWAGISKTDLQALRKQGGDRPLAAELRSLAPPYLYPDQSLDVALRALGQRPLVPVVHRADGSQLVGAVALEDLLRAYRAAEG
ncbi:MAG: chloride channel protein [Vicinamibacterales bacterium]